MNENAAESQQIVATAIGELTGSELDPAILAAAWENLVFTDDPIASSLAESAAARRGRRVCSNPVDLDRDLRPEAC